MPLSFVRAIGSAKDILEGTREGNNTLNKLVKNINEIVIPEKLEENANNAKFIKTLNEIIDCLEIIKEGYQEKK